MVYLITCGNGTAYYVAIYHMFLNKNTECKHQLFKMFVYYSSRVLNMFLYLTRSFFFQLLQIKSLIIDNVVESLLGQD